MRLSSIKRKGFVLIFALWVLGLLTFLAVSVALGVRQKALMSEKLEDQNRMFYLQEAVLKQIKAYIHKEMDHNVVIVKMFPGINEVVLSSIIAIPNLKGIVLENLWFWERTNRRLVHSNNKKSH